MEFALRNNLGSFILLIIIYFIITPVAPLSAAEISETTSECIDCHVSVTPGIVSDWQKSRHAGVSFSEAMLKPESERRVSAESVPESLTDVAVGCAECHLLSPDTHGDTFDHVDYQVHTIVSPPDCAVCHAVEWNQYADNLMAYAHINLTGNELYKLMVNTVNGVHRFDGDAVSINNPDSLTDNASCLSCHGTRVTADGLIERETDLGEMEFPNLSGWPNQGVGRINPDESVGSCTGCHARHLFSITVARKPYTCSQCHKGPDVPAYKVYEVSKHGNIYSSLHDKWNFEHIPWTVGEDFTAPTCAVCHISLVVNEDEEIIAGRTHRMNDRLDKRLFGLIYAHPHPASPNTLIIKNKAGLPLPTELTGESAAEFLIGTDEQAVRLENMKNICRACHAGGWVDGHFAMLDNTVETTNAMTLTATKILSRTWEEGLADGLPQGGNIFDEAIERMWTEQWLFFGNSTRFAAAMGGADYGVFANGRWYMSKNIAAMHDWLKMNRVLKQ